MTDIVDIHETVVGTRIRPWWYDSSTGYLKSLGLPSYTIDLLLTAARIEVRERGEALAYGQEWIHIITRGVIKETTPHGTTRLWRRGAILGDISRVMLRKKTRGESGSQGSGPHITFLSTGVSLSLTTRTFATLIEKEPVLALLLAQLTNDRAQNVESVYAASKADPVVRVARLLRYLVLPSVQTKERVTFRWTRTGVHEVTPGALTLTGPSQADISDALGLGRTTVEKAIASLRNQGVLAALPPGTRSNRYYEIKDYARLTSLARSES
ncbi:Crp/Fnr family transcriptional regulator [Streptomyces achromogenes]|uniref:Crp/Fnr family transcriptional regulator n=1 Tax=Streptomyces achromogenes TaxID=67255 RepID=UPI0036F700D1